MRRWSAALTVLVALVVLGLSLTLRSEALRAAGVLIAAGSITYGWVSLHKKLQSRLGVVLLGTGLSALALGCAWSGLNVVRFYLYNPAMNQVGSYPSWFEIVCTTQVVIQWCGAVAALAFVVILAIWPFSMRSGSARSSKH
jgi:hypothetical protein